NGNSGSGGAKSASPTSVALNVSAVNDAPTLTLPASYSVTAGIATSLGGIAVADVDAGAASLTLTLSTTAGTLSATAGGGVTVSGSGSATLTLSGSAANLGAFLGGGVLFNAPQGFASATLSATLGDTGNAGSGG